MCARVWMLSAHRVERAAIGLHELAIDVECIEALLAEQQGPPVEEVGGRVVRHGGGRAGVGLASAVTAAVVPGDGVGGLGFR